MAQVNERRLEPRLHYMWPVTFTEGLSRKLYCGQMLDLSSGGGSFSCQTHEKCPQPGDYVILHFKVPNADKGMASVSRSCQVKRVENLNSRNNRVAVAFEQPLSFKPAEILHKTMRSQPEYCLN